MTSIETKTKEPVALKLRPQEASIFEALLEELPQFLQPSRYNILRQKLADPVNRRVMLEKIILLLDLIGKNTTTDDLQDAIAKAREQVLIRYEENQRRIKAALLEFQRTLVAVKLFFDNAGTVPHVKFLLVNPKLFLDGSSTRHFDAMSDIIKQRFYSWRMEDCFTYLGYAGAFNNRNAFTKIAEVAYENKLMAPLDSALTYSAKDALQQAKLLKISGIHHTLAHLMLPGTWVYAANCFEDVEKKVKMAVPAGLAILGRMLAAEQGRYISGLEGDPLLGLDGVTASYQYERIDASEFAKVSLLPIESLGFVMGNWTANQSNNKDLTQFVRRDLANSVEKDLICFANYKTYGKFGGEHEQEIEAEICSYFNDLVTERIIQSCAKVEVEFDEKNQRMHIRAAINYFNSPLQVAIHLSGTERNINAEKPNS